MNLSFYANANGNVDHSENSSTRCNNNSPPSNGKSKSSNDVDSNASTTTTTNSVSNTTNGTSVAVTGAIVKNGANTDNLPPGVLYKVKATYKYTQEDTDELSFDVGEIIRVVEYDDPEEQEEGWLMGVKESNGEKGMFPANFTKPL